MKRIFIPLTIILCHLSFHLFAKNNADEIISIWQTQEAQIEIYQLDNRYIGNPISPEGERNTTVEVLNLEYKNGQWIGKIYSKKRGRIMDVICQVKEDKLLLEVSAGFVTVDLEWQKVK